MIWDIALRKRMQHGSSRFELDLQFHSDASRVVLCGPSGAGKTMTLKMIAGIVTPDNGRIAVAGRLLYDSQRAFELSPQARGLAYVFQDYALFPHLTVQQNIAFARSTGWFNPRRGRADAASQRWIEAFGLQAVAHHYPHQLSGGQRQRTALARALVSDPPALLLDEPFAALDKSLRKRLREELAELQAQLGLPLLLITHDDDDVRALGDAVVHVEAGRAVTPAVAVA